MKVVSMEEEEEEEEEEVERSKTKTLILKGIKMRCGKYPFH